MSGALLTVGALLGIGALLVVGAGRRVVDEGAATTAVPGGLGAGF